MIGAGSLSYEMIRALVERLPAMICPRWVDTRTQPVAIDDVLAYLRAALDLPEGRDGVFEIGGPEVVSYGEMMREYARLRGLRRRFLPVPLLTPRLSGLWLGLAQQAIRLVGVGAAVRRASNGCERLPGLLRRIARRWAAAATLAAAVALQPAAAHAQPPATIRAVPFVDLDRYLGDWFEIARLPNRFQRECVGDVRATYGRRSDGLLDVVNKCRTAEGETEARGVARIVDERASAKLKVRFAPAWLSWLPMVWGDYWIIGLAPDYSWAVVGEPGRNYLWILARAPQLDEESIAAAGSMARTSGYDVARLVVTPQKPARNEADSDRHRQEASGSPPRR